MFAKCNLHQLALVSFPGVLLTERTCILQILTATSLGMIATSLMLIRMILVVGLLKSWHNQLFPVRAVSFTITCRKIKKFHNYHQISYYAGGLRLGSFAVGRKSQGTSVIP